MKTLKKFVALMTLAALVVGPAQALAQTAGNPGPIQTGMHVITGGGDDTNNAPVVKVKWEEEKVDPNFESGDPNHSTPGTQINPPLIDGAKKEVTVCAVVTDEQGLGTIATVKAEIVGPDCGGKDPYWYYELGSEDSNHHTLPVYDPQSQADAAIARVLAAENMGLTKYATDYDYQEVWEELYDGSAAVYCGSFLLDYEDPAGAYDVNVKAQDTLNATTILNNEFDYLPVAGFVTDFTAVNYGNVQLMQEKQVYGDEILSSGDGKPTVKSVGNTRMELSVLQDRMGLAAAPVIPITYAARVGSTTQGSIVSYNPDVTTDLVTQFELSQKYKMDFWVTVREADNNSSTQDYTGVMTLSATPLSFAEAGCWGVN